MSKSDFVASLKEGELGEGKMHGVRVKGKPVLLAKVGGEVFGVSNVCPHMGCQLQGGILTGYVVMCPCHGWKFDVRNGQYQENPLTALVSYRCKVESGKVFVEVKK
jgi:nitrite reductase/ring-hydroxylating ferredoxin subunit